MFDRFGEFDSWEEINRAADAQKAEGDLEALKVLAEENGFDPLDAEDFFHGCIDHFCGPLDAALGKIKVEAEEMQLKREFVLLKEELEAACVADSRIAIGVRKKEKNLATYLAKMIDKGYDQAITPPKAILDKVTAVPAQYRHQMKTGMPDKSERKEIMQAYYGEVEE